MDNGVRVEIVSIGDELLIGQTVNTNATWMGAELQKIGASVDRVISIADEKQAIINALDDALSRADVILMTGGLGPTKDDITKITLTEYFDTKLVMHEDIKQAIERRFEERGFPILEVNRLQAMLPEACEVLPNRKGTASGMLFNRDGKIIVSMPGVPYEMKGLMNDYVFPRIQEQFTLPVIVHRTLMTIGRGESQIALKIDDLVTEMEPKGVKVAYLPSAGMVRVRLSGMGENSKELIEHYFARMKELLEDIAFGEDDTSMEQVVSALLLSRCETVSVAESCTGGYLSHLLTKNPGSSAIFVGGVLSYANEVKQNQLGVPETDLIDHGAVSGPVVEQMAKGVRERLGTHYSIATSGVAGPDGGSEEKPVGTVWIAVASEKGVVSKRLNFGRSRGKNIELGAISALNLLRKSILSGIV